MKRLLAFGVCLAAGVAGAAMKSPETSSLFEKFTDPLSGCVSYVLRPGCVGFHQQSWYFTQKSMTDDGRYLLFAAEPDERVTGQRRMGETSLLQSHWIVDFATDKIRQFRIFGVRGKSLDVRTNRLWFIRDGWVAYHDLGGHPTNVTPVCRIPANLSVPGKTISYYCSHLTFNADHTKLFLDTGFDDEKPTCEYWQGMLDLTTGVYENWTKTDFCVNHGQICPADDTLGLAAWEGCWMKKVVQNGVTKEIYRPSSETYPRLWLFRKGQKTMIPAQAVNYATHEHWAEDGRSFYWCSGKGIYSHDVATGRQMCCSPLPAAHADMTADNRYIVFDWSPDWYRGCAWQVCFYDRANGRHVYFHSNIPPLCPKSAPSFLHPDPHPQFVKRGQYIVSTLNGPDGRMSVAVTPTAQLRERTSANGAGASDASVLDAPRGVLGYHLDISNDKVPRMEMMKRIVDIMQKLGYNNLQMNTEHAFAYAKHPAAWQGTSPMTPDEVRELDACCAKHGIELVPNQNSFGHFWRWLRLPEYNALAESPKAGCHSRYRSAPMTHPSSLCPTDPRAIKFVAGLYDELLPCFRSKWVNVGCDETYELDDVTGIGRSAAEIKARGAERVYLDFFKKIHAQVKARGHKMMFWGDIILHKPELIPEIPKDVLCLNWGYGADFPFDREAGLFAASGRRFLICPGTRAWGTVTGNVPEMMANLDRAVAAGEKHGAAGYLLADWDDGGGICPWVVSLPSLVYLSLKLQNGGDVSRERLIARIDEVVNCRCGEALLEYGVIYRDVGGRNDEVANEYCLALRKGAAYRRTKGVTDEALAAAKTRHAKARALFDEVHAPQWLRDDFALLDLITTAAETRIQNPTLGNFRALFEPEYRRLWLTNSRPGGLERSLNVNFGL